MIDRLGRGDAVAIAILITGWIAMAALVDPIADFPLNDDWIYAGAVKSIVEHGHFWLPGPTVVNLFPQAYWGALFCLPFGFSFTALRVSTLTLGLIGVLGFYGLLRRIGAESRLALLGSTVLAVNPLWFNLANGFMTDLPFLSVTILAVLCLVVGMDRGSMTATAAGLALAMVAVLIRQTGVFLLIGYAVAYPMSRGFRVLTLARGGTPLLLGLILHFGFLRWLIATGRAPDVFMEGVHVLVPASIGDLAVASVRSSIVLVPYLGAFVFPFILLTKRVALVGITPRRDLIARMVLVILAALFMAWVVWKDDGMPVLGNLMYSAGIGPPTLRDVLRLHINQPVATPLMTGLWLAATAIGVVGAFLLFDRLARAVIAVWPARGRSAWLCALTLATAASYWAAILLLIFWDHMFFDRYFLYFLPFAMIAVMATPGIGLAVEMRRSRTALAVACIAVYAAFGVAGTHDYLSWNRARWQALDDLIAKQGVRPNQIDGGYEFNGWTHRDPRYEPRTEKDYWWGSASHPYALAYGPIDGYREVGRYPVAHWLSSTYAAILVLHRMD